MASVFKAKPSDERYTIMYYDENKTRRKKMGYASKKDTERLAMKLEDEAKKIRDGLADPKERGYQVHEKTPLADHLEAYGKYLVNKGAGDKHSQSTVQQARDAITLIGAKRISDLSLKSRRSDQPDPRRRPRYRDGQPLHQEHQGVLPLALGRQPRPRSCPGPSRD